MTTVPARSDPSPSAMTAATEPAWRLARRATGLQFLALGAMAGSWGAHIPAVKQRFALDDGELALVLLAAAIGAVLSLLLAGRVVARLGARRTAAVAGVVLAGLLGAVLHLPGVAVLVAVMVVLGAAMSLLDVAINTEGSVLEHLAGRPIMSQLHGMFSLGGMAGAGLAAALLHGGVPPAWQLPAVAAALGALVLVASRAMLAAHPRRDGDEGAAHFSWPRGLLLVLGLLVLAGMIAEGVMYDWCVLYLVQVRGLAPGDAALGYAVFAAAMAAARFAGDGLRARWPERVLLGCGAGLAATAMAVVLLSPVAWVAWPGFALVGAGLAPVAPILFQAATRVPGVSPAAAIAAVTSIGYAGFMVGPPLIGSIATHSGLAVALGVVVLAACLLALGTRWVPEAARRPA